jgi:hypothetical protein
MGRNRYEKTHIFRCKFIQAVKSVVVKAPRFLARTVVHYAKKYNEQDFNHSRIIDVTFHWI